MQCSDSVSVRNRCLAVIVLKLSYFNVGLNEDHVCVGTLRHSKSFMMKI